MPSTTSPTRRRLPRPEREQAMLDAAGSAFATRGFYGSSMETIAEAAGISKPMLYNYFGSKEGLYVAYVERSGQVLLDTMRHASDPAAPVGERLRAGVLAFLSYVDEHRSGWSVLYKEASAQGGPLAEQVAGLRLRVARMLTAVFGDEAFAHAFVGAGESLANWWLEHPEVPRAALVELLMKIARLELPRQRGRAA